MILAPGMPSGSGGTQDVPFCFVAAPHDLAPPEDKLRWVAFLKKPPLGGWGPRALG